MRKYTTIALALILSLTAMNVYGQGVALRAVSTINEGMAGVATATPVDTVGALNWNPATISAFEKSDMSFGTGIVMAEATLESSYQGRAGSTTSDTGAVPGPYMGMIMKDPEKRMTYGFGLYAIGGAQVNYSGDKTNPILDSGTFGGIGRTSAKVELFHLVPTASYQLTDRLSIGMAPTVMIGRLIAEPLFFGPSHGGSWAKGAGTRYVWGAGFQVGLYYKGDNHFNFGFAYKSTQWCEDFPYNISLENGEDYSVKFRLRYPQIYTLGLSYDGFEKTIIGTDVRFFDYSGTVGFQESGYNADGSVKGLGWQSIFSVSVGIQHQLTEKLAIRGGYSFNENPISSESVLTNVPCPLIMQHGLHLGATVEFREDWFMSIGYAHIFKNTVEGDNPYWRADPDSYIRSIAGADVITLGVNKSF